VCMMYQRRRKSANTDVGKVIQNRRNTHGRQPKDDERKSTLRVLTSRWKVGLSKRRARGCGSCVPCVSCCGANSQIPEQLLKNDGEDQGEPVLILTGGGGGLACECRTWPSERATRGHDMKSDAPLAGRSLSTRSTWLELPATRRSTCAREARRGRGN
jgi:hypothetical protein